MTDTPHTPRLSIMSSQITSLQSQCFPTLAAIYIWLRGHSEFSPLHQRRIQTRGHFGKPACGHYQCDLDSLAMVEPLTRVTDKLAGALLPSIPWWVGADA